MNIPGYKFFFSLLLGVLTIFLFPVLLPAQDSTPSPAPPADRVLVLQVPYILQGDYAPLTPGEIHKSVEGAIEGQFPRVDLVVPDKDDSRLQGIDITNVISMSDARKLAKSYNARYVSWGTLTFTVEAKTVTTGGSSYQWSPLIETSLTAVAVADAKIYDAGDQEIVVDQRMIQTNNGRTRAMEGSGGYKEMVLSLLNKCVDDLSTDLVSAIKRDLGPAGGQK